MSEVKTSVETEAVVEAKPSIAKPAITRFHSADLPYIASINIFTTEAQFKDFIAKLPPDASKLTIESARAIYAYFARNPNATFLNDTPYYSYVNKMSELLGAESAYKAIEKLTFEQIINPAGATGFVVTDENKNYTWKIIEELQESNWSAGSEAAKRLYDDFMINPYRVVACLAQVRVRDARDALQARLDAVLKERDIHETAQTSDKPKSRFNLYSYVLMLDVYETNAQTQPKLNALVQTPVQAAIFWPDKRSVEASREDMEYFTALFNIGLRAVKDFGYWRISMFVGTLLCPPCWLFSVPVSAGIYGLIKFADQKLATPLTPEDERKFRNAQETYASLRYAAFLAPLVTTLACQFGMALLSACGIMSVLEAVRVVLIKAASAYGSESATGWNAWTGAATEAFGSPANAAATISLIATSVARFFGEGAALGIWELLGNAWEILKIPANRNAMITVFFRVLRQAFALDELYDDKGQMKSNIHPKRFAASWKKHTGYEMPGTVNKLVNKLAFAASKEDVAQNALDSAVQLVQDSPEDVEILSHPSFWRVVNDYCYPFIVNQLSSREPYVGCMVTTLQAANKIRLNSARVRDMGVKTVQTILSIIKEGGEFAKALNWGATAGVLASSDADKKAVSGAPWEESEEDAMTIDEWYTEDQAQEAFAKIRNAQSDAMRNSIPEGDENPQQRLAAEAIQVKNLAPGIQDQLNFVKLPYNDAGVVDMLNNLNVGGQGAIAGKLALANVVEQTPWEPAKFRKYLYGLKNATKEMSIQEVISVGAFYRQNGDLEAYDKIVGTYDKSMQTLIEMSPEEERDVLVLTNAAIRSMMSEKSDPVAESHVTSAIAGDIATNLLDRVSKDTSA
jgi:hypothetical protein